MAEAFNFFSFLGGVGVGWGGELATGSKSTVFVLNMQ